MVTTNVILLEFNHLKEHIHREHEEIFDFCWNCISHLCCFYHAEAESSKSWKHKHPRLESRDDPTSFSQISDTSNARSCALQNALVDDLTVNLMKPVLWMKCDSEKGLFLDTAILLIFFVFRSGMLWKSRCVDRDWLLDLATWLVTTMP